MSQLTGSMFQAQYALSDDESLFYNMCHSKRGYAIIFLFDWPGDRVKVNGKFEPLAKEKDKEKLLKTLIHLDFDPAMIDICEDYTVQRINDKLKSVANMDHTKNDCLLILISSHGTKSIPKCQPSCPRRCRQHFERRELIYVYKDGQNADEFDAEMLWAPFTGDKSPTLRGKPKLFFIQACRGSDADRGVDGHISDVNMDFTDTIGVPSTKMSSHVDFLIVRSCTSGTVSFFSKEEGSLFLQILCNHLLKESQNNDLGSILLKVTNEIDGIESNLPKLPNYHQMKQTTETTSSLKKKVWFCPKST